LTESQLFSDGATGGTVPFGAAACVASALMWLLLVELSQAKAKRWWAVAFTDEEQ
jgi:hypothetical protein